VRGSSADKSPVRHADNHLSDFSARLNNYVANCYQATDSAKSNDVLAECRSQTTDNACDEYNIVTASAPGSMSAAGTVFLDEVFTSNEAELDSAALQHQQLNQSLADALGHGSQVDSEFQEQEPDDELDEEPFSPASSASKVSQYEQIASYDADIPEIPVSHIRLTPDECEALNQQLAKGFEVVGKTSGSAWRQTEEIDPTDDCNETDSVQSVSWHGDDTCPENNCQVVTVDTAQKNTDVVDVCDVGDGDLVAEALRQAQLPTAPLDLTCSSRVNLTSDADVAGLSVVSTATPATTNSSTAPVNVYNYQTSMSTFSGWSVAQSVTGWPPHTLSPYYGNPGVYPGPCPPAMFPSLQWPYPSTEAFQSDRGRGTVRRWRRAPAYSCSRVDGIRSAKERPRRRRSRKRDRLPRSSSFTNLRTADRDARLSTREGRAQLSATSTDTQHVTTEHVTTEHVTTEHFDVATSNDNHSDLPVVPAAASDLPPMSASSDNSVSARGARGQSRSGRRHARAPRNVAFDQPRQHEDDESEPPPVRRRGRGRPRKRRYGDEGDRTGRTLSPETGVETAQSRHRYERSRKRSRNPTTTRRRAGPGRPRKSERNRYPTDASPTTADRHQQCPTVVGRTETCETSDVETATLGPTEDRPSDQLTAGGSWQPMVSEPTITSLLDRLSITASDHDVPAQRTTTAGVDAKLQPNTSTPFVMLERADLNRCVEYTFMSIFGV